MENPESLLPIEQRILIIRGQRVMLAADIASVYGVTPRRLNQQVNRNRERFPSDFAFRLTPTERDEVVSKCNHLKQLKFSPNLPFAFTEHGALMLASVLNSPIAVKASIQVVRAFVKLREVIAAHKELAQRLDDLEKRCDTQFKTVFDRIRELMAPPPEPPRRIGFRP